MKPDMKEHMLYKVLCDRDGEFHIPTWLVTRITSDSDDEQVSVVVCPPDALRPFLRELAGEFLDAMRLPATCEPGIGFNNVDDMSHRPLTVCLASFGDRWASWRAEPANDVAVMT